MNARQPEQRVGDDVERDEQAVVPDHRRVRPRHRVDQRFHLVAEALAAEPFGVCADRGRIERPVDRRARSPSANASGVGSSTSTPVSPATTVSSAPPRPSATTGRPQACASSGTMPKSSSPGSSTTAARGGRASRISSSDSRPRNSTSPSGATLERGALGAVADDLQRHAGQRGRPRWPPRCACRARAPTRSSAKRSGGQPSGLKEVGVDRRIHDGRLAIIVSADPARNIMRDSDIAVRRGPPCRGPSGPAAP